MQIEKIEQELKDGGVFQGRLSEILVCLAGNYSFISGLLEDIVKRKDKAWLAIRLDRTCKTDKIADKIWGASDDGINYEVFRLQLKKIEKMIGSIRNRIEVLNNEQGYSKY